MEDKICYIEHNGEKKQYAGFSYEKINGLYGYLGIDHATNKVVFIYAQENDGMVDTRIDWLDEYKIVYEDIKF